jgi:hypothetical protein
MTFLRSCSSIWFSRPTLLIPEELNSMISLLPLQSFNQKQEIVGFIRDVKDEIRTTGQLLMTEIIRE